MIRDTFSDDVPRLRRSTLFFIFTQRLRAGLTSRRASGAEIIRRGDSMRCGVIGAPPITSTASQTNLLICY
jgi:hypothetical protein